MTPKLTVLVIGSTGMLGIKIVSALLDKRAIQVKAMVRPNSYDKEDNRKKIDEIKAKGAIIVEGDLMKPDTLLPVFEGVDVVVSAVGNNQVTVSGQKNAIAVAQKQGVKKFIPSDYTINYRELDYGDNHNLDMRKEVFDYLQSTNLTYTSVLNGAFTEILLSPFLQIFDFDNSIFNYWGDGEVQFDTTTTDDTAKYVAEVVSDPETANTFVEVAGDVISMDKLLTTYEQTTGKALTKKRLGSIEDLKSWIEQKKQKADSPMEYLPQQYLYAMVSGKGKFNNIQNARYPKIEPLTTKQYLEQVNVTPL